MLLGLQMVEAAEYCWLMMPRKQRQVYPASHEIQPVSGLLDKLLTACVGVQLVFQPTDDHRRGLG